MSTGQHREQTDMQQLSAGWNLQQLPRPEHCSCSNSCEQLVLFCTGCMSELYQPQAERALQIQRT